MRQDDVTTEPVDEFVQLVTFTVEPGRQDEVADAIAEQVRRTLRDRSGFVSATYLTSLDGTQVLNYARWTSKAAFDAFVADPTAGRARAAIAALDGVVSTTGSGWRTRHVVRAGSAS